MRLNLIEPNRVGPRIDRGRGKPRVCKGVVLSDSGDAAPLGPSILVVESDPVARSAVTEYLRRQAFRIVESQHGGPAIRTAAAEPFDYAVVDIDWVGVSDGAALARWMRTNRPETWVVLTSNIQTHLFPAGSTMATLPLIRKPFRGEDLDRFLCDRPTKPAAPIQRRR